MTMKELLDAILFLIPGAKFAIWENKKTQYQGAPNPIELLGYLIDWNPTNDVPCPKESEILAISKQDIITSAESRRKSERNRAYQDDLSIVAAFNLEKKSNPELTLGDYLDQLELLSIQMKN